MPLSGTKDIAVGSVRKFLDCVEVAIGKIELSPLAYRKVVAAFHGGADGVILSREYSEMNLVNLKSAREALHELGLT